MDAAPIWTDVKTFPWAEFHGLVDILSGGYPCQPFSAAGKRLGAEDPRHLWPFIAAGIAAMRPGACFFENVEGHCSLGLPDVLQDLAGLGYRTTWCVASASECGAPHQRKRIFILAECRSQRGASGLSRSLAGHEGFAGIADDCGSEGCGELEHAQLHGRQDWRNDNSGPQLGGGHTTPWPSRPGEQQFAWEPPRVVVDAKSQRAGQRSELRSEECGSRGALPWDVEQSGEGDVANHHGPHAGHGEQRPERTSRDLSGGCGEAMGNSPQRQDHGREPGDLGLEASQGRCGDHAVGSAGEVLGHASSQRCEQAERDVRGEQQAGWSAEECGPGVAEAMGNAAQLRRTGLCEDNETIIAEQLVEPAYSSGWQAQPSLGRDANGPTHRLDHAVLHVTTDNRTDELRLLGNGVVPATAERAFRVLVGELMEHQP